MATVEKLKKHLDKAKEQLSELKTKNAKQNPDVRKKKKKVKRLARKCAKITYMEKKLAEKSSKKKKSTDA
ncbi:MAG: hypothetical protein A3K09_00530 [Nitrospinae bacterium RIFCSPLOWO2_12_FULL_47_7]|nr:MAG: hypothetical protein A3K09_00530 [Nitrospinae bacterium RIFCSPLOWO2_12_FULL_47_7]